MRICPVQQQMQHQHPQRRGRSRASTQLWGQPSPKASSQPCTSPQAAGTQPQHSPDPLGTKLPSRSFSLIPLSPITLFPGQRSSDSFPNPAHSLFAGRALGVPAATAQGAGGDNKPCFPIDRLQPRFLPQTSKVLNTKQGHGGAAQPEEHKPHCAASSEQPHGQAPQAGEEGKNPREGWRKEEGEWKGRRDVGAAAF